MEFTSSDRSITEKAIIPADKSKRLAKQGVRLNDLFEEYYAVTGRLDFQIGVCGGRRT